MFLPIEEPPARVGMSEYKPAQRLHPADPPAEPRPGGGGGLLGRGDGVLHPLLPQLLHPAPHPPPPHRQPCRTVELESIDSSRAPPLRTVPGVTDSPPARLTLPRLTVSVSETESPSLCKSNMYRMGQFWQFKPCC